MNDTSSRKISCFYTPDLTSSPFSFLCRSRVSIHLHLVPNESQPSSLAATQASAKRPIPCLLCSYIYRPRLPGGAQAAALLALLCSALLQSKSPNSIHPIAQLCLWRAHHHLCRRSRGESNLSFLAPAPALLVQETTFACLPPPPFILCISIIIFFFTGQSVSQR